MVERKRTIKNYIDSFVHKETNTCTMVGITAKSEKQLKRKLKWVELYFDYDSAYVPLHEVDEIPQHVTIQI